MGNFFTNLQVRSSSKAEVIEALKQTLSAPCFVSRSAGGWVSAYPEETEDQDVDTLKRIAKQVSRSLETHVFFFLDHDDDVFAFSLFQSGNLIGDFDSGSNPPTQMPMAALLPLCHPEVIEADIRSCLLPLSQTVFAMDQIASFAGLLGIPEDRAMVGYTYVEEEGTDLDNEAEEITLLEVD